jgi:hypothetical protein
MMEPPGMRTCTCTWEIWTVKVTAAVGEFEAVLRAQVAEARRELAAAREVRDYPGIRSFGLRLRYLLEIAQEHRVQVPGDDTPGGAPTAETNGV